MHALAALFFLCVTDVRKGLPSAPVPFHSATAFLTYFPVCSWFFTCPVFSADQKEHQKIFLGKRGKKEKLAGGGRLTTIMILRSRRRPPVLLAGRTPRLLTSHLRRSLVSLAQEGMAAPPLTPPPRPGAWPSLFICASPPPRVRVGVLMQQRELRRVGTYHTYTYRQAAPLTLGVWREQLRASVVGRAAQTACG
jgi:hypothetical protein